MSVNDENVAGFAEGIPDFIIVGGGMPVAEDVFAEGFLLAQKYLEQLTKPKKRLPKNSNKKRVQDVEKRKSLRIQNMNENKHESKS